MRARIRFTRKAWASWAGCSLSKMNCRFAFQSITLVDPTSPRKLKTTTRQIENHDSSLHITSSTPRCTNAQDFRIRSAFGTGKKEQGDSRGLIFRTIEWQQQANARWAVGICRRLTDWSAANEGTLASWSARIRSTHTQINTRTLVSTADTTTSRALWTWCSHTARKIPKRTSIRPNYPCDSTPNFYLTWRHRFGKQI